MVHKYGNVVNISSRLNARFSSGISNEHGMKVMLINFPLRVLFFHISQDLLISVNNYKAFTGSAETRAKTKQVQDV